MNEKLPIQINLPIGFLNEERRNNFLVTTEMKKLWAVELDLLSEFDRICKKNNIEYMACGGTMLGAIRHKGFIPWDDDIDIMLTWPNYKKLMEIGPDEFREPYFFQTGYTDKGCVRGHAQLRNSNTTAIRTVELSKKYPFNQGIFIDIFCLDNIPSGVISKSNFLKSIKTRRRLALRFASIAYRYRADLDKQHSRIKKQIKRIIHYLAISLKAEEFAFKRYETYLHKYNGMKTDQIGIISVLALGDRFQWNADDINSTIMDIPFEFMRIPVPKNYDAVLKKTYGNWNEYIVGRSVHGELFVDTEKSYRMYI